VGFKSPLIILGVSVPPVAAAVGFRTPLPFWNAGAGTGAAVGFRTPLPFWNAGAGVAAVVVEADDQVYTHDRFQQIAREDEEFILLCRAFIECRRRS